MIQYYVMFLYHTSIPPNCTEPAFVEAQILRSLTKQSSLLPEYYIFIFCTCILALFEADNLYSYSTFKFRCKRRNKGTQRQDYFALKRQNLCLVPCRFDNFDIKLYLTHKSNTRRKSWISHACKHVFVKCFFSRSKSIRKEPVNF